MPTPHLTRGFQVLATAAVLFTVAGIAYRLEPATILGFGLTAAGFFLASTARKPDGLHWGRVGIGLVIAYIGMMPFFFEAFFPRQGADLYFGAVLSYLAGTLLVAAGCFLAVRFGQDLAAKTITRLGAVAITIAGLLWIPLDIIGASYWWTPGNLATFVGGLLMLVGLVRPDATPTAAPGPSKA